MPTELDIELRQGATETVTLRWETDEFAYAQIASITSGLPATISTTAPHSVPSGWRVAVVGARGLTLLNAKSNPPTAKDMRQVRAVDETTLQVEGFSAIGQPAHVAGTGVLQWFKPQSLLGFSARMQVKDRPGGQVLLALSSAPGGGIALSDADKTIVLNFAPAMTDAATWRRGVFDLELVSSGGAVTVLAAGSIAITPQITTLT